MKRAGTRNVFFFLVGLMEHQTKIARQTVFALIKITIIKDLERHRITGNKRIDFANTALGFPVLVLVVTVYNARVTLFT